MSDDHLRVWLLGRVPRATSSELDASVLRSARGEFARRRAHRRRVAVLGVAATVAILATVLVRFGDGPAHHTVERPLRLDVADGGAFSLEAGARFAHDRPFTRLRLATGTARIFATRRPLEVSFPGGMLHVERGEGMIELERDGEASVNGTKKTRRQASRACH